MRRIAALASCRLFRSRSHVVAFTGVMKLLVPVIISVWLPMRRMRRAGNLSVIVTRSWLKRTVVRSMSSRIPTKPLPLFVLIVPVLLLTRRVLRWPVRMRSGHGMFSVRSVLIWNLFLPGLIQRAVCRGFRGRRLPLVGRNSFRVIQTWTASGRGTRARRIGCGISFRISSEILLMWWRSELTLIGRFVQTVRGSTRRPRLLTLR